MAFKPILTCSICLSFLSAILDPRSSILKHTPPLLVHLAGGRYQLIDNHLSKAQLGTAHRLTRKWLRRPLFFQHYADSSFTLVQPTLRTMRPTRLLLSIILLTLTIIFSIYSLIRSQQPDGYPKVSRSSSETGLRTFFSFHAPTSLFPPSAIISLTDDNSTFFLARPAAYGPLLPANGLSGQLWIGSGFGDENLVRGGAVAKAEGELGCSDISGWSEGHSGFAVGKVADASPATKASDNKSKGAPSSKPPSRRSLDGNALDRPRSSSVAALPREDEGTDDHLHYPLQGTPILRPRELSKKSSDKNPQNPSEHADIQSLQEGAEIAGKVVLLSRGGCGFLEKTKWVQRRGGVALIVGDSTRGGNLISMYARGDSSNVTIPSLFTSRTTAQLLSSLIPFGHSPDGGILDDGSKPDGQKKAGSKNGGGKGKGQSDAPQFTPTFTQTKSTKTPKPNMLSASKSPSTSSQQSTRPKSPKKAGWWSSLASGLGLGHGRDSNNLGSESRRPPSSGRLNWIISDTWDDEPLKGNSGKSGGGSQDTKTSKAGSTSTRNQQSQQPHDNFVIGVQDWRDPDLVAPNTPKAKRSSGGTTSQSAKATHSPGKATPQKDSQELSGGSRAPGSGVYHGANQNPDSKSKQGVKASANQPNYDDSDEDSDGWLGNLFGGSEDEDDPAAESEDGDKGTSRGTAAVPDNNIDHRDGDDMAVERDSLWVTMTPASASTSPFFDTILVLVVSPLVTLTIVYALLLLRSRIRRHRWRAPKSVVDRLPVRTYHTMSCSSTSTSSQTSSPHTSSPTSPLLHSSPRPGLARPRSRTLSIIRQDASNSLERATTNLASPVREKPGNSKKKYRGRQVECVVCLEEYVDGQSRVMSLPCGHEFHKECM